MKNTGRQLHTLIRNGTQPFAGTYAPQAQSSLKRLFTEKADINGPNRNGGIHRQKISKRYRNKPHNKRIANHAETH